MFEVDIYKLAEEAVERGPEGLPNEKYNLLDEHYAQYSATEESLSFFPATSISDHSTDIQADIVSSHRERLSGSYGDTLEDADEDDDIEMMISPSPSFDGGARLKQLYVVPHLDKRFNRGMLTRLWHRVLAMCREAVFVVSNVPKLIKISVFRSRNEWIEISPASSASYEVYCEGTDLCHSDRAQECVNGMNDHSKGLYLLIHGLNGMLSRTNEISMCTMRFKISVYELDCTHAASAHRASFLFSRTCQGVD